MPFFLLGLGVLAVLLWSKSASAGADTRTPQQRAADGAIASAAANANAAAKKSGDEAGAIAGVALGAAVPGVALIKSLIGGGAVAAGTGAAVTGGAVAGTGAAASAASATAVGVGVSAGAVASAIAGGASVAIGAIGFIAGLSMAVGSAFSEFGMMAQASAEGNSILYGAYRRSMKATYQALEKKMLEALPQGLWATHAGAVRCTAILITLAIYEKINALYKAGVLAQAPGIGLSWAQHESWWAVRGVFVEDWDNMSQVFISDLGAGSLATVRESAKAGTGTLAHYDDVLAKASTIGKMLFYFSAFTGKALFTMADSVSKPIPWLNHFCIFNPVVQRVPFGQSVPFDLNGGAALSLCIANARTGFAIPQNLELLNDIWQMNRQFDLEKFVFVENGLRANFLLAYATGSFSYETL